MLEWARDMEVCIYARSALPLSRRTVIELIEACRCAAPLRFDALKTVDISTEPAWSRLLVHDSAGRALVMIEQVNDAEAVRTAIEELFVVFDISRATKTLERIRARIESTVRLFRIVPDGEAPNADVQVILPQIAVALAKASDGVIRFPERGRSDAFLDASGKQIYRL